MDLSIIIVNWNSTDYLRTCLTSVYRETKGVSAEIIVVDNGSRDDSCAALIKGEFPDVIFRDCKENVGFARGSNLGYELSKGEMLLFLNPDTEIRSNVFQEMVNELRSSSNVGAVGVRLLNTDGSLQASCIQTYPTILNQVLDSEFLREIVPTSRLWGMKALFVPDDGAAKVDVISGACLMVKRKVFEEVGYFDSSYFMYVEDVDLCRRICALGYANHYINSCEVIHHGGKSSASQGEQFVSLRRQEAMMNFFASTKGRLYSISYRLSLSFTALLRLLVIVVLLPFRGGSRVRTDWMYSLRKWSCIFGWTIGIRASNVR
jgi:GT2 family glycosyltransferase